MSRIPPILPGATIGIVGGGQLGRMMALEARRMAYRVVVLDPQEDAPAAQVADEHIAAPLGDLDAARELARRSDVVTLEWENADAAVLRELEGRVPLRPGPRVLEVAQHRLREKETARRLGLRTPKFAAVRSAEDLSHALRDIGTPAVLKTVRGGYDGRGQAVIRRPEEAEAARATLSALEPELILEEWIDFRLEVSAICARTEAGEIATYPIGENIHREGILDASRVPAPVSPALAAEARGMGEALAEGLGVVGLLAVEIFVGQDDRLYFNEIAPRPHNSGHYTWEACAVSQFEQHLRAVCALPLGTPEQLRPAGMVNLLGDEIGNGEGLPALPEALAHGAVSLHLYGKREARPRRKMGHLTALAVDSGEALALARRAREILTRSG
ncbi:MAG TPA: 5-(carboxyamino)imidazole ribonucleotide synthase [Longimicrobiaceae bacterium]|nr:5-(carboxyamino)imidazole ribonucleotide synthase [Longimicrobiaceae bacterium]